MSKTKNIKTKNTKNKLYNGKKTSKNHVKVMRIPNKLPIDCSEIVLFTGTYNINDQINNGVTYTILPKIQANPNGYNTFVGNYYNTNDGVHPQIKLLLEYNNIASYLSDYKTKIGQIQFTGLDINATSNNVASVGFRVLSVNSASGIYEKVVKVIIDNRKLRRIVYFLGKK